MIRFLPWIIGGLLVSLVVFVVADQWGAKRENGTATVIAHDYEEAYTIYDINTKSTTYYDEEFILEVKYEDIVFRDTVRKHIWNGVIDGDKVTIVYYYGNFSGGFNANITGIKNE